jgi:hypothetical protein
MAEKVARTVTTSLVVAFVLCSGYGFPCIAGIFVQGEYHRREIGDAVRGMAWIQDGTCGINVHQEVRMKLSILVAFVCSMLGRRDLVCELRQPDFA